MDAVIDLLVPTKLYAPPLHAGFVARPHLVARLAAGLDGRLTLLSAPAGFGKTTLLAAWVAQQTGQDGAQEPGAAGVATAGARQVAPLRVAWLALDAQDNEPARFLSYLLAALQKASASLGETALRRLHSSQPLQAEAIFTALIGDLDELEGKLALILDDYHLISTPAIHTALAFLLEHAPPQLHLVIASRSDPPLSLSRWRVRGELTEIRAADLRFTAAETSHFLDVALDQAPGAETAAWLAERTEGWAAGLQLAALSLRGLDAEAAAAFAGQFGGRQRYVFSYLIEEVLQRQPPAVQQFLLQTTVLDRLTAPLCAAVTEIATWESEPTLPDAGPGGGAQAILDYLAANNLFLMPLDGAGQWFRYHTLFAEALQARLQTSQPDLIPVLHRRAGDWYAAHGYTEKAIHHALAAGDIAQAAGWVDAAAERHWQLGHLGLLLSWLDALPVETLLDRPHLGLLHAWLLFLQDRWAAASERIHQVGQRLDLLPAADPQTRQHRGRWAAIQGAMAAHRQDAAAAIAWMESALQNLPGDDIHWQQVATIGLGLAQLAEGQARPAMATFRQVALACEQHDDLYLAFAARWHQVEACWAQGQLHGAAEALDRLEQLGERDAGGWLALPANAAIGRAILAYERDDLAGVESLLLEALPQVWPGGQPRIALQAYLTLARLAQARKDAANMQRRLDEAGQVVRRYGLAAEAMAVSTTAARLLLADGQLAEAHWQLEKQGLSPEAPATFRHEAGLLALVRLYLAERRADEALQILERLIAPAELAGRAASLLELSLLRALALAQGRHQDRALASLHRALALGEPEGYARVFINEGRPLARLLEQLAPRTPYADRLLARIEQRAAQQLVEPLTARELEILRLVAEGATNQAIADKLFIGLGTVKGHMNHILAKLDAHNRTEAVVRGRQWGLL